MTVFDKPALTIDQHLATLRERGLVITDEPRARYELTDDDKLVYVNHVLKGKLMASDLLRQQAVSNTKEQFANSPDLAHEIMNAVMDALAAHTSMSKQALDSERVRTGLKDILLGPAQLYEALRSG